MKKDFKLPKLGDIKRTAKERAKTYNEDLFDGVDLTPKNKKKKTPKPDVFDEAIAERKQQQRLKDAIIAEQGQASFDDDLFGDLEDDTTLDDLLFTEEETAQNAIDGLFDDLEDPKPRKFSVDIEWTAMGDNIRERRRATHLMILECIASRELRSIQPDYSTAIAIRDFRALSQITSGILAGDEGRWYMFVFAREWLYAHATDEELAEAKIPARPVNPGYDHTAPDKRQDKRVLGSADDYTEEDPVPVREQAKAAQTKEVEDHRENMTPAVRKIADAKLPLEQIWEVALTTARQPRESWEGKLDWMLEQKVKWAYHWLYELEVNPPKGRDAEAAIFWKAPSPSEFLRGNQKDEQKRRADITHRVMNGWRKWITRGDEGLDLKSTSYRTVLAAMELTDAIEEYVKAGVRFRFSTDGGQQIDDAAELAVVKQKAKAYYLAHFPVHTQGGKPGPTDTLDPEYPEYLKLLRKYKLPVGALLHELNL